MATTAVVGSLIALDRALIAISTMTRRANVESCSMVRSGPNARDSRSSRSSNAPPRSRGLANGDEIADPGHDLDYPVSAARFRDQRVKVGSNHDGRCALMGDDLVGRAELLSSGGKDIGIFDWVGINALDD